MSESFSLRFPFRATTILTGVSEQLALDAGPYSATLTELPPYLVLKIDGFESEEKARDFLSNAWASVMWASVRADFGLRAETQLSTVVYSEDPVQAGINITKNCAMPVAGPVDGLVNGNFPSVLKSEKNIVFINAVDVTVSVRHNVANFLPHLEQGLRSPNSAQFYVNERLRVALELWSDYHRESSTTARFLTLAMALEVLTHPSQKHQVAQSLLDKLDTLITTTLANSNYDNSSDEYHALESLRREMVFRRETSIRSRVRDLVTRELASLPDDRRDRLVRLAVRAYDLRGALVHKGRLAASELSEGHAAAREVVRELFINGFGRSLLS